MTYQAIAVRLPSVGSKRVCVSCTNRFYDLARTPPVCPKCGAEQPPEPPRALPIRRGPVRHRMMKSPAPAAREADDDAAPVLETDEDEADAEEEGDPVEEDVEEEPEADSALDEPPRH